jgi:antitoxin (DNA-binding transcriptional repressor) of toxin-antitoxin stability system
VRLFAALAAVVVIVVGAAVLAHRHLLPDQIAQPINRQVARFRIASPAMAHDAASRPGVEFVLTGGDATIEITEHGERVAKLNARTPRERADAAPGIHTYHMRIGGSDHSVVVNLAPDTQRRVTIELNHLRVKRGSGDNLASYRGAVIRVSDPAPAQ